MKYILFIIFIHCTLFVHAQEGINFLNISFEDALQKAKEENKLVFVDCYTSWCGPCKQMAEEVFTDKELGIFFNKNFISVKYDTDKPENKYIVELYDIQFLPTFLFIRPDRILQHKIIGGWNLKEFLYKVKCGMNEKQSLLYFNTLFSQREMTKEELVSYKLILDDAGENKKSAQIEEKLNNLLSIKDKMSPLYWPILEKASYGSEEFKFIIDNIATFNRTIGAEKIGDYIGTKCLKVIYNVSPRDTAKARKDLAQIKSEIEPLDFPGKPLLEQQIKVHEAYINLDTKKVLEIAEQINTDKYGEIEAMSNIFFMLSGIASKEELKHFLALEEKYSKLAGEKTDLTAFKKNFDRFRARAYTGVYFYDLPFQDALKKANAIRNLLFIDCYTT